MEVKRTIKVNTDQFEVGDVIKFKLADGEKVQARAVKQTSTPLQKTALLLSG